MAFFTSDLNLAEETANPKQQGYYQPTAGLSPLSSTTSVTGDPLSQFAQSLSGGTSPNVPDWNEQGVGGALDLSGSSIGVGGMSGVSSPIDTTQLPTSAGTKGYVASSDGDESIFNFEDPYAKYGEDASWYKARDVQNMSDWQKMLLDLVPFGSQLGMLSQYDVGINPLPGAGNYIPFTDTYIPEYLEGYSGPGSFYTDEILGLGTGEQRDMLIAEEAGFGDDEAFWESPQEARDFYEGTGVFADSYGISDGFNYDTDTWVSDSSDEGTWTDDTGSVWSTDDYSSQEEYDDDWSFDDWGWDDW